MTFTVSILTLEKESEVQPVTSIISTVFFNEKLYIPFVNSNLTIVILYTVLNWFFSP